MRIQQEKNFTSKIEFAAHGLAHANTVSQYNGRLIAKQIHSSVSLLLPMIMLLHASYIMDDLASGQVSRSF